MCNSVTVSAPSDSVICNSGSSVTVCVALFASGRLCEFLAVAVCPGTAGVVWRKEIVRLTGGRVGTEFIRRRSQGFR